MYREIEWILKAVGKAESRPRSKNPGLGTETMKTLRKTKKTKKNNSETVLADWAYIRNNSFFPNKN